MKKTTKTEVNEVVELGGTNEREQWNNGLANVYNVLMKRKQNELDLSRSASELPEN